MYLAQVSASLPNATRLNHAEQEMATIGPYYWGRHRTASSSKSVML
jgi:hypothetical protein